MAKYSAIYSYGHHPVNYEVYAYGNTLKETMLELADRIDRNFGFVGQNNPNIYRILTTNGVNHVWYTLTINRSSISYSNLYGRTFTAKR